MRRQVFFCSLGGFDTHGAQSWQHWDLLRQVSEALAAFYNATVEMGVADRVTSFTLSDFGRTLQPSGSGSDHGWGSHQLILGGAVQGGRCTARSRRWRSADRRCGITRRPDPDDVDRSVRRDAGRLARRAGRAVAGGVPQHRQIQRAHSRFHGSLTSGRSKECRVTITAESPVEERSCAAAGRRVEKQRLRPLLTTTASIHTLVACSANRPDAGSRITRVTTSRIVAAARPAALFYSWSPITRLARQGL